MKEGEPHNIFEENFGNTPEFGRFGRNLNFYRLNVFHDDFVEKPPGEQPCLITKYSPEEEPEKFESTIQSISPIEGGFNNFVNKGKSFLDIGAGEAVAIREMAKNNLECQYYGLDMRYSKEGVPKPEEPNVHLVGGTWFSIPFRDGSFDRLVSVYSFPFHLGRTETSEYSDEQLAEQAIAEFTRIAQEGAIWRGVISSKTKPLSWRAESVFPPLMVKYGWQLTTIEGNDGEEVFIAKLVEKES